MVVHDGAGNWLWGYAALRKRRFIRARTFSSRALRMRNAYLKNLPPGSFIRLPLCSNLFRHKRSPKISWTPRIPSLIYCIVARTIFSHLKDFVQFCMQARNVAGNRKFVELYLFRQKKTTLLDKRYWVIRTLSSTNEMVLLNLLPIIFRVKSCTVASVYPYSSLSHFQKAKSNLSSASTPFIELDRRYNLAWAFIWRIESGPSSDFHHCFSRRGKRKPPNE